MPDAARGPALGLLELSLIARGVVVADAAIKRAEVELVASRPVSGGKHLVILSGGVAEIGEAMTAAEEAAGDALVDRLMLPYLHAPIWDRLSPAIQRTDRGHRLTASLAIVETSTVCAAVHAADAASKAAPVTLLDMRLAIGISGKAFFTMTADLPDIEAASEAARTAAGPRLLALEIIASPGDTLYP